jgi:CRP-like cAMP-binding protein
LRLATATAITESAVMRVEKAEMVRILHEEPSFGEMFTAHPLTRKSKRTWLTSCSTPAKSVWHERFSFWRISARRGKPEPITTQISQETLAEIVGTTRSRVNVFMNKFRQMGFIEYNGEMKVHNSLLNVILHDKPQLRRGEDGR